MKKALIVLFTVFGTIFLNGIVQADLNDGLVAYYPFNGNANDESGNGNHGTVNGTTLTTSASTTAPFPKQRFSCCINLQSNSWVI